MRRLLLLVMALLSLAIVEKASSQILMDENFNYPAGDSIGAHGWVWNTGTTNTIMVATPGLTYTGYPLSGIGNKCHLRNNGNDAYKQTDSTLSGSVYVSFMIKVDSVRALGDYFLALLPNNSTTNYTARFYLKDTTNGVSFGVSKGTSASNTVFWTPGTYTLGSTYLVVIKYTFLTGSTTDDEIRVYIFTSGIPATEPGSPTLGVVTGPATDAPNISRVALRQGSATIAPTLDIDGIRVFRSWTNIVGIHTISAVAEDFSLTQNYPNPFNPSTKINFSIPERGFVALKVYDMLGKEVTQLVGGDYSRGTYSVDFNAAGLSSGVYFYSIEVNTASGKIFKDMKKLSLVK
jgi:hypothetical protein